MKLSLTLTRHFNDDAMQSNAVPYGEIVARSFASTANESYGYNCCESSQEETMRLRLAAKPMSH